MTSRRKFCKEIGILSIVPGYFMYQGCKPNKEKKLITETVPLKDDIRKINIGKDSPYFADYIKGNIGYFTERGGTIGWYCDADGYVVIDTQFPKQAANLMTVLMTEHRRPVDLVINTHHHSDHTAGNVAFEGKKILAHVNSKKNQSKYKSKNGIPIVLPNDTFEKEKILDAGKETMHLEYHGPAHTDGDITIHFRENNVVHLGDLVFNRKFPYIDSGAGANIENWVNVLDRIDQKFDEDTMFIFGHSGNGYDVLGKKQDIHAFRNYLESLLVFGRNAIQSGKTLDEVKANTEVIPGAEEWKGSGIERSLDAVYAELS